jgi:parallel beta-helix repeat protein
MKVQKFLMILLLNLMLLSIPLRNQSVIDGYEQEQRSSMACLRGFTNIKVTESVEIEKDSSFISTIINNQTLRNSGVQKLLSSTESNVQQPIKSISGVTEYQTRGRIEILNDSAFGPSGYNFPGNGTEIDPYMISGYNITDSSGILIHIEDTSKHFKIENCYLDGNGSFFQCIYLINVNYGTIKSNIICDTLVSSMFSAAIHLNTSHNITLLDNTIFDCDHGIFLSYSLENTILNNTIRDNKLSGVDFAIFLNESSKTTIVNNTIHDFTGSNAPAVGIFQFFSDNNLVHGNLIYNLFSNIVTNGIMATGSCDNNNYTSNTIYNSDTYAIYIQDNSNNNTVFNNTLFDLSTAIALYDNSRFNNISNNIIYNITNDALSFTESHNNTVSSNVMDDAGHGLYLFDSYYNTFRYNSISNSSYYGLYIYSYSGSEHNIFEWNNFINNSYHAFDQGSNNGYSHNYWDNHTSPDADNDGFVDTPYYIGQSVPDSLVDPSPRTYPYMSHAPIFIEDNADFAAYGFPGDGTQQNPYLISNYYFMDSSGVLITIQNTTAYFKISYNVLNGLGSNFVCINLSYVTHGTFVNNIIYNSNREGISLDESNKNSISGNTIYDCQYGIYLMISHNNTLLGNINYHCFDGINLVNSNNNSILGSTVYNNSRYGIYLAEESNNNNISYNNLYNNTNYGLVFDSSPSAYNTITRNNLFDNNAGGTSQASDSGTDNLISYNYWNNWTTPDDLPPFGIVDIPYTLDGLINSNDSFPLTTPAAPIVTIVSPLMLDYGTDTITVMLTGYSFNYWYYIDGIHGENQTWIRSVDESALPDGTYTLHAYGNNSFGIIVHSSVTFTIDTLPPVVTIMSPTTTTYTTGTITVELMGDAATYWYFIEGIDSINQTWDSTITRNLADGTYTLHAYGDDSAGNKAHAFVILTIDTTPPVLEVISPINTTYNQDSVLLNYTVSGDAVTVTIYLNGIANDTAISSGQIVSGIPDGSYNLTIVAVDQAGNIGLFTVLGTIDTTLPTITIVSPTTTTYTTGTITVELMGDAATYFYFIESVDNTNLTWDSTVTRNLADGTYILHAYGVDSAGNEAHAIVTFTIDTSTTISVSTTTTTTQETTTETSQAFSFSGIIHLLLFLSILVSYNRKRKKA